MDFITVAPPPAPNTLGEPKHTSYPRVKFDSNTRLATECAIVLSVICCITCFLTAGLAVTTDVYEKHIDISDTAISWKYSYTWFYPMRFSSGIAEFLAFVINIVLTLCSDGLAYVHSISLRWALIKEKRLEFNTNIRLFRSSQQSFPNGKTANFFSAIFLILGYAGTSQLFLIRTSDCSYAPGQIEVSGVDLTEYGYFTGLSILGFYVNPVALIVIGISLAGQIIIATLCLLTNLRGIPTWTANPINTTLAALKNSVVEYHRGKCLQPTTRERQDTTVQVSALAREPSASNALSSVCWYICDYLWILSCISMAVTITCAVKRDEEFAFSWTTDPKVGPVRFEVPTVKTNSDIFLLFPPQPNDYGKSISLPTMFFLGILFAFAVQGLHAIGMHLGEFIVNLSRDEHIWRQAGPPHEKKRKLSGASLSMSWVHSTIFSWHYLVTFFAKAGLHWLLGQCLIPTFSTTTYTALACVSMSINVFRLILYTLGLYLFAGFVTVLAIYKPRGPMPSTWGNIQTLADLIDDWKLDERGRIYWGDKGLAEGFTGYRHAGTSDKPEELGPIHKDAFYW
jgi:hypothetical protein